MSGYTHGYIHGYIHGYKILVVVLMHRIKSTSLGGLQATLGRRLGNDPVQVPVLGWGRRRRPGRGEGRLELSVPVLLAKKPYKSTKRPLGCLEGH